MAKILKVWPRAAESAPGAPNRKPARGRVRRMGTWVTLLLVFCALVAAVSPVPHSRPVKHFVDEVWSGPAVTAPFDLSVVDDTQAAILRDDDAAVTKVFVLDPSVEIQSASAVRTLLQKAREAREAGQTPAAFQREVNTQLGLPIRRETAEILIAHANNRRVETDLAALLRHVYVSRGVTADKPLLEAAAAQDRLLVRGLVAPDTSTPLAAQILGYPDEALNHLRDSYVGQFQVPALVQQAYRDIARQVVRPNIAFDRDETMALRETQAAALRRAVPVAKGQVVVRTGDALTRFQAATLDAIHAREFRSELTRTAGSALFVAMFMMLMMLYARKYRRALGFTSRNLLMVSVPVLLALLAARFGMGAGGLTPVMAFAFPAGMVGLLGTILFGSRFAIVLCTLSSLLLGMMADFSLMWTLPALVGGWTAVASLYNIRQRREVLMAGVRLALVNCVSVAALGLVTDPETIARDAFLAAVINGLACYVLTIGMLPIFETVFGITTDVRLMELTSTSHPLMQELEEKAPGTFQHVLSVTKLAEQAAEDVGANYLLVRAGAYFHDIGKMFKPKYFTENQVTPEERRIHGRLSPYMSTLIIRNHVKEGIELARRHHLPEKVIDFIPQHHGTSLIKYFYSEALNRAEANAVVNPDDFRYPGPRPQTKEAAIVMIADSVEAVATAKLTAPTITEDDVRKLVRETVMDKFEDHQFDEANMTMHDLHHITESFTRSLLSRYHKRIDYPTIQKREVRDVTRPDQAAPAAR